MSKKVDPKEMVHGMPSGKHEPMKEVLQGWDDRIEETKKHNAEVRKQHTHKGAVKMVHKQAKNEPLPSDLDPSFSYGMSTHDIDIRLDPFLHSNAVIEQRQAQQERELKRLEARQQKENTQKTSKKRLDPTRATAASIGHTKHPDPEPGLKDTFKMKRFTQFEHGVIDSGIRKSPSKEEKA